MLDAECSSRARGSGGQHQTGLLDLDDELLEVILEQVPQADRQWNAPLVCRRLAQLVQNSTRIFRRYELALNKGPTPVEVRQMMDWFVLRQGRIKRLQVVMCEATWLAPVATVVITLRDSLTWLDVRCTPPMQDDSGTGTAVLLAALGNVPHVEQLIVFLNHGFPQNAMQPSVRGMLRLRCLMLGSSLNFGGLAPPRGLAQLQLTQLCIGRLDHLSTAWRAELCQLTLLRQLQVFYKADSRLSSPDLAWLASFTRLNNLRMKHKGYREAFPAAVMSTLAGLTSLVLSVHADAAALQQLAHLTNLRHLYLHCGFLALPAVRFAAMRRLRGLDLTENRNMRLGARDLAALLKDVPTLRSLKLDKQAVEALRGEDWIALARASPLFELQTID